MIPGEAQHGHLLPLHVVGLVDGAEVRSVIALVDGGKALPVTRHVCDWSGADGNGRVMIGINGVHIYAGRLEPVIRALEVTEEIKIIHVDGVEAIVTRFAGFYLIGGRFF